MKTTTTTKKTKKYVLKITSYKKGMENEGSLGYVTDFEYSQGILSWSTGSIENACNIPKKLFSSFGYEHYSVEIVKTVTITSKKI